MTLPEIENIRQLLSRAKFGPLKCDNYFPAEIYEDTPTGLAKAIEVRGWGWLQKREDGEQMQDARGRLVQAALDALPRLLAIVEAAQAVSSLQGHPCGFGTPAHRAFLVLDNALAALSPRPSTEE